MHGGQTAINDDSYSNNDNNGVIVIMPILQVRQLRHMDLVNK